MVIEIMKQLADVLQVQILQMNSDVDKVPLAKDIQNMIQKLDPFAKTHGHSSITVNQESNLPR